MVKLLMQYLTSVALILLFTLSSLSAQIVHQDYVDGELFIRTHTALSPNDVWSKQKTRYTDLQSVLSTLDVTAVDYLYPVLRYQSEELDNILWVKFTHEASIEPVLKALNAMDVVDYAERVPLMKTNLVPNDPGTNQVYALSLIDAFDAFDIHTGGNSVICVVDNAIQITHPDLAPNVWVNPGEIPNNGIDDDNNGYVDDVNGWDAADNDNDPNPPNSSFSHGTHCSGTAAAATNNGTGVASIGYNCKLMSAKATRSNSNNQYLDNTYGGTEYAIAAGADVVSMSFGGGGFSNAYQSLFNFGHGQGITFVAAAGNDNTSQVFYPAGYNYVISVASTTSNDSKSSFSNYGSWIDIAAPGSGIYSTIPNNTYGTQSGTSMACPLVAGLCGLLKSYNPALTPDEIENCLDQSADNIDAQNPSYVGALGAGRINALGALQCTNPTNPPVVQFMSDANGPQCTGATVQFMDQSLYNPTSWTWSFPGGSPATSTVQNPTVTYANNGLYDVTLTATNQYGSTTLTESAYIEIGPNGVEIFFDEDFESGLNAWTIENPDAGETWEVVTVGGTNNGNQAARVNNYNYDASGQRDAIISPVLDFTGRSSLRLNVDYAHRRYSQNQADSLIISISTDGGNSYTQLFGQAEDGTGTFATGYTTTNDFIPSTPDDWCYAGVLTGCIDLDLSAYDGQGNVLLKIENVNDYGNNMYVDNVQLSSNCFIQPGAPTAQFSYSASSGCPPITVQYTDESYGNPAPSSWSWSFPGGSPSSSTQQNPTVTYGTDGTFDVSLTVSNGNGSDTYTQTGIVTVNSGQTTQFYFEDFEVVGQSGWTLQNPDGSIAWAATTNASGINGSRSIWMNFYNYQNGIGQEDYLFTQNGLDFTGQSNVQLTFDYAYARFDDGNGSINSDKIEIFVSTDGGNTYPDLVFTGEEDGTGNFSTSPDAQSSFVPSTADDWCGSGFGASCPTIDMSAYDGLADVRLRVVSTNNYGNNFYIDNIDLSSGCSPVATGPSANFSSTNATGCAPFTVTYTNNSLGAPTSEQWLFPGGNPASSTSSPVTVNYNNAGQYDVTLIVSDGVENDTLLRSNYVDAQTPQNAVCQNTTVALNANGIYSLNASEIDVTPASECGNPDIGLTGVTIYTCNNLGPNNIVLTYDYGSFQSSCAATVTVVDNRFPDVYCANTTVSLDANGIGVLSPDDVDNGSIDNCSITSRTLSQTTFSCADIGPQFVVMDVTDASGNTESCSILVNVVDGNVPIPSFGYGLNGLEVNFNNASNGNWVTADWNFGDGGTAQGDLVSHTYAAPGQYIVSLTLNNGCTSITEVDTITVFGNPNSIENFNIEGITANPNPTQDIIELSYAGSLTSVDLELQTMLGQQIWSKSAVALGGLLNERISLANLAGGNYILSIIDVNGNHYDFVVSKIE
tara:strand:+ start:191 stop:4426 length:4236 start_codon:yes stop_codon:yes gene_type:complete